MSTTSTRRRRCRRAIGAPSLKEALACAAALALGGCTLLPESVSPPEAANAIAVPAGHALAMTLHARGTVNFECRARAGMAGAYMWTVDAPDAVLRHWSGWPVGRLYAGPTWAHRDGSQLTGRLVGAVSAGAGKLPDQLWRVTPSGERGEFSDVVYVSRRNASGGALPSAACGEAQTGRGAKSEYEAQYGFYRRATPP